MKTNWKAKILLSIVFVFVALISNPVWGQATKGTIVGTVVDTSGAGVPGADVTVRNTGSNRITTAVTSAAGVFRVPNLEPGVYEVRVAFAGFRTFTARDVKVNVGEEYSLRVVLEVGSIDEQVSVVAGVDIVNTTDSEVGVTIQQQQIVDLPLEGRNPLNLITLQAGTANNSLEPTSIGGLKPTYTSITLDGVNIQDNFLRANATTFTPVRLTQSNVGEFSITTANQGVEKGFGASQVNFVTPAGTNDLHGEVFWVHRSPATDASDFFSNLAGTEAPFLLRNQYGAAVTGPIIKDKLFFYAHYEGMRERQGDSFLKTTLSNSARQGIFKYEALDGTMQEINLLDLRGAELDPTVQSLLSLAPSEGNDPTAGDGFNTLGYRTNLPFNWDQDQVGVRIDFILNDSHSFEGIYRWTDELIDRPDFLSSYDDALGFNDDPTDFFSTAWQWTLSPSLINEVRFGANLTLATFADERDHSKGFKVGVQSFSHPLGGPNAADFEAQGRETDTWNYADNLSWIRGDHSFRFGFQGQTIRVFDFAGFYVNPSYILGANVSNGFGLGSGEFPGGIGSGDLSRAENILADLAGALDEALGEFHILDPGNPFFEPAPENWNWEGDIFALYFGDSWRVSPRLTLNAGVRWEYYKTLSERDGLMTAPRVASGDVVSAVLDPENVVDWVTGDLINPDYNNFAPNLGLAWDMFGDGKTSLRVGYGIAYSNDQMIRAVTNTVNLYGVASFPTFVGLSGLLSNRPEIPTPDFKLPLTWPEISNPASPYFADDIPTAFVANPDIVAPYAQTWQFGVTREIAGNTALEVRYVGTRGTKLHRSIDVNQVLVRENGFLDDFVRAQSNGEIAQAAGFGYDPRYNPNLAGSQSLPVFDQTVAGGLLFLPIIQQWIQEGSVGGLMDVYYTNGLNGGVQAHPNPQVWKGDILSNQGDSTYHGLQLEARRRFSDGLMFTANYTFSKVITDVPRNNNAGFEPILDLANPTYGRGRSAFDVTHVFNTNFIWELPFGQGRRFDIENSILNQILGGWRATSILNWQSGDPFSILSNRGSVNSFGRSLGLNRASSELGNQSIGDVIGVQSDEDGPYFLPSFLVDDELLNHPGPGELGGLPRFGFTGPSFFNWDFGLIKAFDVMEELDLEFRAEFFNFTNHTNFAIGSDSFEDDTTLDIDASDFGRLQSQASDNRIIQFSLKVLF